MELFKLCDILVLLLMTILSVFGNSLVVISTWKFEWLKSPTHYLVALLAYFDLCNGVPIFVSRRVVEAMEGATTSNSTLNYDIACRAQSVLVVFASFGEGFSILMIAIDRCLFLNWPLRYHRLMTKSKAKIMASCCLGAAVTVSLFVTFSDVTEPPKPCLMSNVLHGTMYYYLMIPVGMTTFVAITVLYVKIFMIAYKARKQMASLDHMNNLSQSEPRNNKTTTMACMVAIFIITHIIYMAVYIATRNRTSRVGLRLQVVAIWIARVSDIRDGSRISPSRRGRGLLVVVGASNIGPREY